MKYYQDLITAKSFKILQDMKRQYKFILIGGWAVFLYTQALKSKDVDIIVDYEELEKLRADFTLIKNNRLRKYEVVIKEIDIDIYVPFYSHLGIPVEDIKKYSQNIEGFMAPKKEILLILKQTAYFERQASPKGEKDKIDIISLLAINKIDFVFYKKILEKHNLKGYKKGLQDLLQLITEIPELGLNQYQYSKLKKKILRLIA